MSTGQSEPDAGGKRVVVLSDESLPARKRIEDWRRNLSALGWRLDEGPATLERLSGDRPDAVLTTGSAHAVHETGASLAAETGIPWIADVGQDVSLGEQTAALIYDRAWLVTHGRAADAERASTRHPSAGQRVRVLREDAAGSVSRQTAEYLDELTRFPPAAPRRAGVVSPSAAVVIPTRNRRDLLRRLILSSLAQTVPVEVLVMDDGSTDGSPEMVRREFPEVRLYELGRGMGPAFQRNRGVELASAEIVFPVDDDSVFSTARVVEQTILEFADPRVAAVGIPFLNPRLDWTLHQRAPDLRHTWIAHTFVGAAHAVRRSVFLEAGGYREHFFYMGEEGDLCLRFLQMGHVVRLGNADPVHHMESPRRNLALADYCGRRNDVLFAWHNVPTRFLPAHLAVTTLNGVRAALRSSNTFRMLLGLLHGYTGSLRRWQERRPVSVSMYRLHRRLKKSGLLALDTIEQELPEIAQAGVETRPAP
jgi:GT2 family glycosyltransferase